MLLFLGFVEWEVSLIKQAAESLDIGHLCQFQSMIGNWDMNERLTSVEKLEAPYPAVVFVNAQHKNDHWLQYLKTFKLDEKFRCIPIVGLGNLNNAQIEQFYDERGNSYLAKPATYEEMVSAASATLNFWLSTAMLPGNYLNN